MKKRHLTILLLAVVILAACKKDSEKPDSVASLTNQSKITAATTIANTGTENTDTVKYMRIQLAKDSVNTDGIMIIFKPGTSNAFFANEDARTLVGFGMVSLSSLSSDNIPLVINELPLPKPSTTINLAVNSKTDGIYKLNLTAINAIPVIYDVWLMDNYKKDSLDLRHNNTYEFNLSLADTNSYGKHRFSLVVRQNKANAVHLLNFTATKTTAGAQLNWRTENEENYTGFSIERSSDNGQSYLPLTSFISTSIASYNYIDKNPVQGIDMYRLKMTDLNGAVTYTQYISLDY